MRTSNWKKWGHFSNNKEGCDDHGMIVVSIFMFYHWVRPDKVNIKVSLPIPFCARPAAGHLHLPQDTSSCISLASPPAWASDPSDDAQHSCLKDEIISHASQIDSCAQQKVTNCRTTSTRSERRLQNHSLRSDSSIESPDSKWPTLPKMLGDMTSPLPLV
jgi:hypothetical protein